jgi:hypothetical protein
MKSLSVSSVLLIPLPLGANMSQRPPTLAAANGVAGHFEFSFCSQLSERILEFLF